MELDIIRKVDSEIAGYIEQELKRQQETIELSNVDWLNK